MQLLLEDEWVLIKSFQIIIVWKTILLLPVVTTKYKMLVFEHAIGKHINEPMNKIDYALKQGWLAGQLLV